MSQFLKAIRTNGEVLISEYTKNQNAGKYMAQMSMGRPFNGWTVVGNTHPVSGETVMLREWRLIAGRDIVEMMIVVPKAGFETSHNYDAANFQPKPHVSGGSHGVWIAPSENTPDGAVAGVAYPIHLEATDLRRFVILRTTPSEQRFYIEAAASTSRHSIDELIGAGGTLPADGDEDVRPSEMQDEDND